MHALQGCLFHKVIDSFVSTAFPGSSVSICWESEQGLATQRGLLTWTGTYAHWQVRGARKLGPPNQDPQHHPRPNIQQFLHTWTAGLGKWLQVQRASIPMHLIKAFVDGIKAFSAEGTFRFQTPRTKGSNQGKKHKSAFSFGLKQNCRVLLREAQEHPGGRG